MPVTPTFAGTVPTVGGSADTWGTTLNTGLGQIKVDVDALALQSNENETLADGSLQRSGGDMSGEIYIADVAPTNVRSVGFRGVPVVTFDADRTLGLTDSGKMMRVIGSAGRTITVPANASVPLPIGTAIPIRNYQTVNLNIVGAVGVTLSIPGSGFTSGARVMSSSGLGTLVKEDTNIWVLSGIGVS